MANKVDLTPFERPRTPIPPKDTRTFGSTTKFIVPYRQERALAAKVDSLQTTLTTLCQQMERGFQFVAEQTEQLKIERNEARSQADSLGLQLSIAQQTNAHLTAQNQHNTFTISLLNKDVETLRNESGRVQKIAANNAQLYKTSSQQLEENRNLLQHQLKQSSASNQAAIKQAMEQRDQAAAKAEVLTQELANERNTSLLMQEYCNSSYSIACRAASERNAAIQALQFAEQANARLKKEQSLLVQTVNQQKRTIRQIQDQSHQTMRLCQHSKRIAQDATMTAQCAASALKTEKTLRKQERLWSDCHAAYNTLFANCKAQAKQINDASRNAINPLSFGFPLTLVPLLVGKQRNDLNSLRAENERLAVKFRELTSLAGRLKRVDRLQTVPPPPFLHDIFHAYDAFLYAEISVDTNFWSQGFRNNPEKAQKIFKRFWTRYCTEKWNPDTFKQQMAVMLQTLEACAPLQSALNRLNSP